jgi:hemolysin activation/secretion protein
MAGGAGTCVLALALLGVWAAGWGAAAQDTLRSAEPGLLEKRIENIPPPQRREAEVREAAPEAPAAVQEPSTGVVLTAVDIEGATVYSATELAPLYEAMLARRVGRAEIERLLDAITKKYRADGYSLVRAIAPPQRLDLGVLRVRVIEGYVDRVTLSGEEPASRERLEAFLRPVLDARPLRLETLERHTLLLGELPGFDVRAALRPIDEANGIYELRVDIQHKPVGGSVGLDNRGTQSVGTYQGFAAIDLNSVLGYLESTRLTVFAIPTQPHELVYGEVRHEVPIGSDGLRVAGSLSRSISNPGDDLRLQDVASRSLRGAVDGRYPVLRSRAETLYVTGQAYWSDAQQEVLGTQAFSDHIRAIGAGARYLLSDGWDGQNQFSANIVQGLPVLGASEAGDDLLSRPRGHGDFTKGLIDLSRQQLIDGPWSAMASLSAQKAGTTLLSGEEFSVGGARFGRGYDPAEISGSNGAAGALELRYDGRIAGLGPELTYQVYGFGDFGAVWGGDPDGGVQRDSLASAGMGVRFGFGGVYLAEFEAAKPLTRGVASEGNKNDMVRFFFRLNASF